MLLSVEEVTLVFHKGSLCIPLGSTFQSLKLTIVIASLNEWLIWFSVPFPLYSLKYTI